jgi:hypothetical protein
MAKWAARLNGVREVSVRAEADLTFWQEKLRPQQLCPIERDGKAQLLIIAADARFKGIRFKEVSFSILASAREADGSRQGAYLLRAFNSRRFFAFCERRFFATPYDHGDVQINLSTPVSIQLAVADQIMFRVAMIDDPAMTPPRTCALAEEDGWEGPVYLPNPRQKSQSGRFLFARVRGLTKTYSFQHEDVCSIKRGLPIFDALADSRVAPTEWQVRENAAHAKSKTYKWSALATT